MCSAGGLRYCQNLSRALVESLCERVNLHTLCQMEGGGKVSAVFWPRNALLDLRNISQGLFSWTWLVSIKILASNKRQICPKFSTRLKRRCFLASQNMKDVKTSSYFLWGVGKVSPSSERVWLHTSTPYSPWVHSIRFILLSRINFPLKILLSEIRKKPGTQLEKGYEHVSAVQVMAHDIWEELLYYCAC